MDLVSQGRSDSTPRTPSGTVTFVFTDIEGSTVRWERDRPAMQAAVRMHDAIMRTAITAHSGYVFKTIGDAFCAAFSLPEDAVSAMLEAQRVLGREDFSAVGGIRVRMAIHTGTADERDGDYFGPAVNRVARLLAIAHGGQVLLSGVTAELVRTGLPPQTSLRDLGDHRLKDLVRAEHVFQLMAPDISAEFPPLRSLNTMANNLPLQVTSFIGREFDVAEISALRERHRMVTLIGAGGVGKTRTALQVAANALDHGDDGVWFVEFAPLANGEYVPQAIAQAAGVTLGDGDSIADLVTALRAKSMLLVFDNCEHLVAAIASVAFALISACPRITILATSRQALGITGEATYRMPSFSVPPAFTEADGARTPLSAREAMKFSAVALFVERAQSANNRFELADADAPIVADICRRLDGIALAIELAAARMTLLSPHQIDERLNERFRVLTGGVRDKLPRQQTLRALIDWSYDLLDEREQSIFRRLGIFVNGFTLEAAHAVCGAGEFDEFVVLDEVGSLTEKCLVMAEMRGDTARYYLLESTRAYAAEKLAEIGERDLIAGRHLHYYCNWLTRIGREAQNLRANTERAFTAERDNIRFALDDATARGEHVAGAELLAAVSDGWVSGGLQQEGIVRLATSLVATPASASALSSTLGSILADLYARVGRLKEALDTSTAAVRAAREAGNGAVLARALSEYAVVHFRSRDFSAAEAAVREGEETQAASPLVRANLLLIRGHLSEESGNFDLAAQCFIRLRDQFRALGNFRNTAICIGQIAQLEFRREKYAQAADLWREAVSIMRKENRPLQLSALLLSYGITLAINGDYDAAAAAAMESLNVETRPENMPSSNMAVELCAYILAMGGDTVRAARFAGYVDASFARTAYVRNYDEQVVAERLALLLAEKIAPDILIQLKAEGELFSTDTILEMVRSKFA